jgi:hypothetical protein
MSDYVSQADYDRLQADYDNTLEVLREQLAENETLQTRLGELEPLEARVRELSHGRAFDKLAEELGVRPEARDDAWKLLGYKPESEEVDETTLRSKMAAFVKDRPFLLTDGKARPTKLPKDEFAGKSGSTNAAGSDGVRQVTRDQLKDPEFTSRNGDLLRDPSAYEIVDD